MTKKEFLQFFNRGNYEDLVRDVFVDFPAIIDTDFASLGYIIYKYGKSKYLDDNCLNWTEYFAKCKLVTREKINPISVALKEEYKDQADSLYEEIYNEHWEEILKLCRGTDILPVIYNAPEFSGYKITVNCRNELEEKYIKNNFPKWSTCIESTDIKNYFCLILYDINKSLSTIRPFKGKSILIYYHKPNFLNYKEGIPNLILAPFVMENEIRVIEPYKELVLPYDMTPNDMEVKENGKEYRAK